MTPQMINDDCAEDSRQAYLKGIKLLSIRERSAHEMRKRLSAYGFNAPVVDDTVDRLQSERFLDDNRYAAAFIRSKLSSGWGTERISMELERDGIDIDSVPGFPDEFIESDEYTRAWSILEHKPPHGNNPRANAYRRLMSKGFSSGLAAKVAHDYTDRCS